MHLKKLAGAVLGLAVFASPVLAQSTETPEPEADLPSLDALKKGLIDTTPGLYLSPIFSLGYVAGDVDFNQGGFSFEDEFDGWLVRLGGAVGYQDGPLRSEAEFTLGHVETELDQLDQENEIDFFKFSALSFFDVPYDVSKLVTENGPETSPYFGMGVGGLYYDVKDGDSDVTFVAEVLAGLGFRLSPRWFVDGGYRWTYIPRLDNEGAESEISFNGIEAKLRYRF